MVIAVAEKTTQGKLSSFACNEKQGTTPAQMQRNLFFLHSPASQG